MRIFLFMGACALDVATFKVGLTAIAPPGWWAG
jgi:hypothetical protein